MRFLIILAVLALLVVAGLFFFGGGELDLAPRPTPSAHPTPASLDFSAVRTLLQQDMTHIPASLDSPRVTPTNAFSVKSRLEAAAAPLPEYQTLAQVCDLIIFADREHSVRQAQDKLDEQSAPGDPANAARTATHARAQADWDAYRQQTDAEVHRLLATLPGAKS